MSQTVSGAPNLAVVDAITQFVGGTQAVWNAITVPVPAGLVVYAIDTTAVKMGDGTTLYANLPTLFTLNQVITLTSQMASLQSSLSSVQAALSTAETTITNLSNEYATLLSAVGNITPPGAPLISTSGNVVVNATQELVCVKNAVPAPTSVTLPANPGVNEQHTIKDLGYNAQQGPITVLGNGHQFDNGLTQVVIDADGGALSVWWDSAVWVLV